MTSLSIAEAAEHTGLTAHTLRYYERDGLMLAPVERARPATAATPTSDLGWIQMLTRLRATGMPIRDVRRYAALVRDGDGNEAERLAPAARPPRAVEASSPRRPHTCARSTTRSRSMSKGRASRLA